MSDKKAASWRKKISSKPKDLQLVKASLDDTTSTESGRHRGWRKTIQASRPGTPTPGAPAAPTSDETEAHSESLTCSIPRRDSKPKLIRYTSLFSGFKDVSKGPDFDTPWDDHQPTFEPYVDPKLAIQSIRSHMVNFSVKPIPLEYSNNLFCIFEHYHKLCEENNRLDMQLQSSRQYFEQAEHSWAQEEQRYAEEIRRLELLISKGTSGVAGVIHARQGSVIDRKHLRRTATSVQKASASNNLMTQEQLVAEIKSRSHQVLLQRPGSPSSGMAALSQRLGRASTDVVTRTPADQGRKKSALSRKVQSELNLTQLTRFDKTQSIANSSIGSAFSGDSGDLLPDEVSSSQDLRELSADCNAMIALRELGALVARRRGLNADAFVKGVVMLLSEDKGSNRASQVIGVPPSKKKLTSTTTYSPRPSNVDITPKQPLRRFQSQPQLNSDQKRRRHFSFELGEDHLQAWNEEVNAIEVSHSPNHLSVWTSSISHDLPGTSAPSTPNGLVPYQDNSTQESHGASASKIPSPLQAFGNVRRETSVSSLKSSLARSNDGRRNSRSSILTAYRDDQNNKLRPASRSRSSSRTNSHGARVSPSITGHTRSIRGLISVDGRSSEHTSHTRTPRGGSPSRASTKSATVDVSSQATRNMGGLVYGKDKPSVSG